MTNFVVKQFAVQLWLYYVELCSQKSKLSIKSQIDFFVFLFCSLKSNQRQKHTQKISITNRRIHFLIIVVDARKRKAKLCFQIWMTKKINKQNSFLNLLTLYSIPFWSCWSRRRSREKWRKNKDEALLCFTPRYRSILMLMLVFTSVSFTSFLQLSSFTFFSSHKLRQHLVPVGGR